MAMWAAQRRVCGRWVVSGAPKRTSRLERSGVPSRIGSDNERIADYNRN
jgi:hypothetical protein